MNIPVLVLPPGLTKQLKVLLDRLGWRDKDRLIARYNQIQPCSSQLHPAGLDTSTWMAMALLPNNWLPIVDQPTLLISIQEHLHSSGKWPAEFNDPAISQSCLFLWTSASAFAIPRHRLAQTPLERLRQLLTELLTPILASMTPPLAPSLSSLLDTLPQKWEHYSDFTLLPATAFVVDPWPRVLEHMQTLDRQDRTKTNNSEKQSQASTITTTTTTTRMEQLEAILQEALQSTHIARKAIIPVQDILRRPKIRPLAGDWGIHNPFKTFVEDSEAPLLMDHAHVPALPNSIAATATASDQETTLASDKDHGDGSSSSSSSSGGGGDGALDFEGAYWAMTSQNHVWYSWAPMFTMFSAGNITEKERVAHSRPIFDARDKVVVDLYAGIGYFTLVYLVHAGARIVHACEWNPWSVEGLCRGATKNGIQWAITQDRTQVISAPSLSIPTTTTTTTPTIAVPQEPQSSSPSSAVTPYPATQQRHPRHRRRQPSPPLGRLQIYPGDNAQWIACFENTADHVNLGLIPSAEPGWVLGVRALGPQGGFLHVHHNVRQGDEAQFETLLLTQLLRLFRVWKPQPQPQPQPQQQAGLPPSSSLTSSLATPQDWSLHVRHIECVKSFAPLVYHYVYDVECRPPPL